MKHTHKLWIALILTGIVGGMVGIALTELMHLSSTRLTVTARAAGMFPFGKAWFKRRLNAVSSY